jgi:predicted helicase
LTGCDSHQRELPRIPFPPDIQAFANAGKRLMELHIDYEQQSEYPLEEIEQPGKPWTLRVERMSLSKDKTELRYNEALTLRGIPPAAFDYRLGNRSALEWGHRPVPRLHRPPLRHHQRPQPRRR